MNGKHPVTGLVTRARAGDKQAWDALVDRYAPLAAGYDPHDISGHALAR